MPQDCGFSFPHQPDICMLTDPVQPSGALVSMKRLFWRLPAARITEADSLRQRAAAAGRQRQMDSDTRKQLPN